MTQAAYDFDFGVCNWEVMCKDVTFQILPVTYIMCYLIHEEERFIIFKTRGAAVLDMIKRDFSSVLNDFKYAAL